MASNLPKKCEYMTIANKYKIDRLIGKGSFGDVYSGQDIDSAELVAIKLEKNTSKYRQLAHENKVYQKLQNGIGIAKIHCFGSTKHHDYLVMDLLGPSLEKLFNYCKRKFTITTTLMATDQMIRLLEFIHQQKFIHRDIKPDNFVLGPNGSINEIYLIDFGLAKRYYHYINNNLGEHIPLMENNSFTGTARYASINSQKRLTQSRRDDLESIGYIMVYFLKGSLPWQNVRESDRKQRKEKILEIKLSTPISELCDGLPIEIQLYLKYCRERKYDETPSYVYLRKMLSSLLLKSAKDTELEFDWNKKQKRTTFNI